MYELLGMNPKCLELWKQMHQKWKLQNPFVKIIGDALRLTGQASTSIGNFIVNLVVHNRFFR